MRRSGISPRFCYSANYVKENCSEELSYEGKKVTSITERFHKVLFKGTRLLSIVCYILWITYCIYISNSQVCSLSAATYIQKLSQTGFFADLDDPLGLLENLNF